MLNMRGWRYRRRESIRLSIASQNNLKLRITAQRHQICLLPQSDGITQTDTL